MEKYQVHVFVLCLLVAAASTAARGQGMPHRVHNGWADLRNEAVLQAGETERERGTKMLEAAANLHGLAKWRTYTTLEVVARDTWSQGDGWWPARSQGLRHQQLLDTFTSRVELQDGPGNGEVWGIQAWATYKQRPGESKPIFLDPPDTAIHFYLPTLQYFNELPFRLLRAGFVTDAGPGQWNGQEFDRVFASWANGEACGDYDQYVVWIGRGSKRIEMVHYTVRDAASTAPADQQEMMRAGAVGTMHYLDYRDVQGVQFPFRQFVTLFGPEQAQLPLENNYFHAIEVTEARFDAVPRDLLLPDPGRPKPGDSKP